MKRMYVVLTLVFLFVFWAGSLLGQQNAKPVDDQAAQINKRMQMREEMHRRMMDKILKGIGSDQDLFQDMEQFLNDAMSDSFSGIGAFTDSQAQNFTSEWEESAKGKTFKITPKTPDQQLDIDVSNGLISIKGKREVKTPNGIAISNFSNSFNVPSDCDHSKVKMDHKNGKILVHFPYRSTRPAEVSPKKDLKPLPPSDGAVEI